MDTRPIRGFKKSTITKTIQSKMDDWIAAIRKEDKDLADAVKNDYIVTGGCIASMLLGELPNDYDVYLKSTVVAKKLADFYLNKLRIEQTNRVSRVEAKEEDGRVRIVIKSAGIAGDGINNTDYQYFEMGGDINKFLNNGSQNKSHKDFEPAMITDNAISLYGGVQIIIRFVGMPEDIHRNYDYIHATNWYTAENGLVLNQAALESILARELRYVGSLYPICSLFRMRKFIKRGWSITAGEVLKISWDVSKLDLSDFSVLQDQLIGVDQAYFWEILACLKKNNEKEIDRTYLYEIINRVFDDHEFGVPQDDPGDEEHV